MPTLCPGRVAAVRSLARDWLDRTRQLFDGPTRPEAIATLCGVAVAFIAVPDLAFGSTTYADEVGPIILINSARVLTTQRFRLAHELGHVLRGDPMPRDAGHDAAADLFALELLLPAPRLARQLGAFGEDLDRLSYLNGVKAATVKARLCALDLSDPGWRDDGDVLSLVG